MPVGWICSTLQYQLRAGTYIPNIADVIFKHNEALQLAPKPSLPVLNFKSVLIG